MHNSRLTRRTSSAPLPVPSGPSGKPSDNVNSSAQSPPPKPKNSLALFGGFSRGRASTARKAAAHTATHGVPAALDMIAEYRQYYPGLKVDDHTVLNAIHAEYLALLAKQDRSDPEMRRMVGCVREYGEQIARLAGNRDSGSMELTAAVEEGINPGARAVSPGQGADVSSPASSRHSAPATPTPLSTTLSLRGISPGAARRFFPDDAEPGVHSPSNDPSSPTGTPGSGSEANEDRGDTSSERDPLPSSLVGNRPASPKLTSEGAGQKAAETHSSVNVVPADSAFSERTGPGLAPSSPHRIAPLGAPVSESDQNSDRPQQLEGLQLSQAGNASAGTQSAVNVVQPGPALSADNGQVAAASLPRPVTPPGMPGSGGAGIAPGRGLPPLGRLPSPKPGNKSAAPDGSFVTADFEAAANETVTNIPRPGPDFPEGSGQGAAASLPRPISQARAQRSGDDADKKLDDEPPQLDRLQSPRAGDKPVSPGRAPVGAGLRAAAGSRRETRPLGPPLLHEAVLVQAQASAINARRTQRFIASNPIFDNPQRLNWAERELIDELRTEIDFHTIKAEDAAHRLEPEIFRTYWKDGIEQGQEKLSELGLLAQAHSASDKVAEYCHFFHLLMASHRLSAVEVEATSYANGTRGESHGILRSNASSTSDQLYVSSSEGSSDVRAAPPSPSDRAAGQPPSRLGSASGIDRNPFGQAPDTPRDPQHGSISGHADSSPSPHRAEVPAPVAAPSAQPQAIGEDTICSDAVIEILTAFQNEAAEFARTALSDLRAAGNALMGQAAALFGRPARYPSE